MIILVEKDEKMMFLIESKTLNHNSHNKAYHIHIETENTKTTQYMNKS